MKEIEAAFASQNLNRLDGLFDSINIVNTINEAIRKHPKSTVVILEREDIPQVYNEDTETWGLQKTEIKLEPDTIWKIKRLGFGVYQELRSENLQIAANRVMVEAGIPQELNVRQKNILMKKDEEYDLWEKKFNLQEN